jgi:Mrp family chromosome partitioning ATPase/capsular polysaccharide biosynthesis protein
VLIKPRHVLVMLMSDRLGTLSRYKLLIVAVAIVMGAVAYALTARQAAQYQATSKLLVNQNTTGLPNPTATPPATDPTQLERLTSTQIHLAQIPDVARAALLAANVGDLTPTQLLSSVTLTEEANADLIDVVVTAGTSERAQRLSAAFAGAVAGYQSRLVKTQLARELAGVQATIASQLHQASGNRAHVTGSTSFQDLLTLRNQLAAASAGAPRSSVVVGPAQSAVQTAPKPLRNGGLAAVLGLLLGCGLAFLFDARDRRVRTTSEIGDVLALNLLARLPAPRRRLGSRSSSALTMLTDPSGVEAEAIKMLQVNLELARLHRPAQAVLFTSAVGQEGKSSTVANLAVSLAQAGRSVVVIDGDLRHPSLSRLFGVPEHPGLGDLARGGVTPDGAGDLLAHVELGQAGAVPVQGTLHVLAAGRREEQPDRLLSSPALPAVFAALRTQADWLLVDAPPLTRFYDALIVSQHVDAIVAVARVRFVERAVLAEFGRLLSSAPAASLGFAATGVGRHITERYELGAAPAVAAPRPDAGTVALRR